jgi:integrase
LEEVPPELFEEYLAGKRTASYRRLILTCAKMYLQTMGHATAPILQMPSIAAEPPTEMRTVGREDAAQVISYLWANKGRKSYRRTLAMFLLSWEGGLRASELCDLTMKALDLDRCIATVLRKGGRKVTALPFSPTTAAAIKAYLKDRAEGCERVFVTDEGRPMDRNSWRLCLLRLARAAKVEHFSPHALRRGGSVEMMMNGAPDEVIMRLYGWSDHALLSRYTMAATMERARQWLPTAGLPAELQEAMA